jgi:hypothetical protein
MGHMVSKRIRKGIAKQNRKMARLGKIKALAAAAPAVKAEVKAKKETRGK